MSVRSSILAVAAVAAGFANLSLAAAPAVAPPVDTVLGSYADLNLDGLAGREILDRRIARAASQLCGYHHIADLSLATAVRACQADTISAAQPQRDAAMGLRGTVRITSADRVLRVSRAAN